MGNKQNFIEMRPVRYKTIEWENKEGTISLRIRRDRYFDKFMNIMFNTPKTVTIDLDDIGSFVWERCDGAQNIYEICKEMEANFGERVNPPLERLITYIRILNNNNLIELE